MDHNWPLFVVVRVNHLKEAFTGQRSMGTMGNGQWAIEVTEINFEVSLDLGGHLEAETAKNKSDQSYSKI